MCQVRCLAAPRLETSAVNDHFMGKITILISLTNNKYSQLILMFIPEELAKINDTQIRRFFKLCIRAICN
jgi:hypothetical protein